LPRNIIFPNRKTDATYIETAFPQLGIIIYNAPLRLAG